MAETPATSPFGARRTARGWVVYNTATGRVALAGQVFADQITAAMKAADLNYRMRLGKGARP